METLVQTNLRLRKRLIKLADMLRIARHSADHDVLTGLANRRLLYDRLQQAMALADRQHLQLAVLMMDLDGFKTINDRLGHNAGDVLLQQVAGRLSSCLRMTDTASRLGGDEFVVMLPQISGPESVSAVIAKLRRSLAAPYLLAQETVLVGTSIGVTLYKGQRQRPAQLLQQADRNMYRVKMRRHERASALRTNKNRLARERKQAKAAA
ncbi:putative signaling protein [Andreprevotia sp. IGB-42]|uniref:GGDEF domain-containing protein n=1 Tax=Andreprevotia sp. IGB-42 TaxID=2497473 RepID=UPI0013597DE9|nr:GGDEF domain-containing protein [Andreprevotia sp. IGB-42]KAF0814494.1 putative signaling protein [Andreprevotia sp. IGB-42]